MTNNHTVSPQVYKYNPKGFLVFGVYVDYWWTEKQTETTIRFHFVIRELAATSVNNHNLQNIWLQRQLILKILQGEVSLSRGSLWELELR
jgi:hypothetical protein